MIQIEKNFLSGNWSGSKSHIEKMASINIQQACLQEMNIYILEGNLDKAKEIGNKILKHMNIGFIESTKMNNYTNNFYECALGSSDGFNGDSSRKDFNTKFEFWNEQMSMHLRLNYINIYIALREYSNALILAIKFYHEIKQLDFNYEFMMSCLILAKILIHMEYPEQAIKYIEKCIIFVLANGSLLDQAKLHYLYAKCLHMLDKRKNFEVALANMVECVTKLETIQASIYLISAYAYISFLFNESGLLKERNKYAFKFRQLRTQLPLIGYLL
jgi:tetratricopeptide (TPR) repeat protein